MTRRSFTTLGKFILGLMVLLYLASVTAQAGLLLLFIGLVGGCVWVNWRMCRKLVQTIAVEAPRKILVCEGSRAEQPWVITAKGSEKSNRPVEQIEIHSGAGLLFRIATMVPGETLHAVPNLLHRRRGVYPHADLKAVCAAPFGLVQAERTLSLPGETVVYPRVYPSPLPGCSGTEMLTGGKLKGGRRVANGTHFAGIRDWQAGDPIKQIDWKSSAKRNGLMVRTFEEELSGKICFVLDIRAEHAAKEDAAARLACSMILGALTEGHHVEVFDLAGARHQRFPPFADPSEPLELLARYTSGSPAGEAFERLAERLPRRAAVALVVAQVEPEHERLLDTLRRQARKTTLCVPHDRPVHPSVSASEIVRFNEEEAWSDHPFDPRTRVAAEPSGRLAAAS